MSDLISRQAAVNALWKALYEYEDKTEKQFIDSEELDVADWILHRIFVQNMSDIDRQTILGLPSAQPEITDEQAIEHLQSTGWMQNHDREMYDMGFKEQLADDSGSYDSLLPPAQSETMYYPQVDGVTPSVIAQPERKKGKWLFTDAAPHRVYCSVCYKTYVPNKEWIAWADDMIPKNFCPNCGASMQDDFSEHMNPPE